MDAIISGRVYTNSRCFGRLLMLGGCPGNPSNENPCSATPRPLLHASWSPSQTRRNSPTMIACNLQLQIWNLKSMPILARLLKNGVSTEQLCVGGSTANSGRISNFALKQNNAYRMHRKKPSLSRLIGLVNEEYHPPVELHRIWLRRSWGGQSGRIGMLTSFDGTKKG